MKRIAFIIIILVFSISLFSQSESSSSSTITHLQARVLDDEDISKITLSWTLPSASVISSIRIYRSTSQIFSSIIKNLEPIASVSGNNTNYIDTVPNVGAEYYYALLTVINDKEEFDVVIPSVNATVSGIRPLPLQVKLAPLVQPQTKETPRNERTQIPLPYLNIVNHSEDLKNSISVESQEKVLALGLKNKNDSFQPLYVFPEDKNPLTGEQYLLSNIINSSFVNNDWVLAENDLNQFLSINRSEEINKRATFYLAQVLYYQARYSECLRLFLDTENTFPDLTKEWIESVLLLYQIP